MTARFSTGAPVRVRSIHPPAHLRKTQYMRGREGVVEQIAGHYANPEELAYGRAGLPREALYRVRFRQAELWPDYAGAPGDSLVADIYEHWLEPAR
jgi:nitrile hydratase